MGISASSLERVDACPPSAVLPQAQTIDAASEGGNEGHDYLANVASGMPKEEALLLVPVEKRPWLAAIDLSQLPVQPDQFQPEVAFLHDRTTGEVQIVGQRIDRGYEKALGRPLRDGETPGTVDSCALTVDRRGGAVADYKSGWAGHVAPARKNWQLRFLALCLARAYSLEYVTVAIVRFSDDGSPLWDRYEFDALEIEVIAAELERVLQRVDEARRAHAAGGQLAVTMGDHCRYCPALLFCPAQRALIKAALADVEKPEAPFYQLPESDEEMALLLDRAKMAEKRVEQLLGQIKLRGAARPFLTTSGKVYGEVRRMGDPTYEAEGIHEYLVQRFGPELADKCVESKTSWSGIERAVRAWSYERGDKRPGKMLQELEQSLFERGLIKRVPIRRVLEFKATDEQLAAMRAAIAAPEPPRQLEAAPDVQ